LSYAILKGLTIRTNLGYSAIHTNEMGLGPKSGANPLSFGQRVSEFNTNEFVSQIIEPQLEYNTQVKGSKINLLLGGSYQSNNGEGNMIRAAGYNSDNLMTSLMGYTAVHATRYRSEYRYEAAFAQLNINHNSKYILNAAVRRDGSSRFGPDKRFSNFGSVGAAWLFSGESIVNEQAPWLSFGKLRSSYGITGNDKIANYQFLDTWMAPTYTYDGSSGLYPAKLFNGEYHWEKSNKFEVALELGFVKDKVFVTANYYHNLSSNPLVQYQLPAVTGFTNVVKNLPAKVSNTGWELTLNTNNIDVKDFSWTTSFNLTLPKNKLESFDDLENSSYSNTYVVGEPLDLIYKYRYLRVNPETGLSELEDKNKDGMFVPADDYQVLGSLNPKYYGGLSNTIKYKNWQFDFLFSFRKQTGFSYLNEVGGPPGGMSNIPVKMAGFWTKPGDDAPFQRLTQTYGDAYFSWSNMMWDSNRPYEDASFIRLRNVQLSWKLPDQWVRQWKMNNARVYVQAQNLLTITSYEVGDPESQALQSTPPLRTVVFGLQLSF
jgi:TonB-linked SusC/RagA family outer membrane protein